MPKLPPVWALFLFAVLFMAIACEGGQGLAGPAGPQGPRGEQGPQGKIGPAGPDGPAALKREPGTETFRPVLGARSTPTPLPIKPSVLECEIAQDADVETGHRATQPPTLKVEIPKFQGDYTPRQINRWRKEAEDAVWRVPGVWSSWIDVKQNRIIFAVYTIHVAEKAREALAETDVPINAVIFEVDPKTQLDDPPVEIDSPMGIRISLEFQRNVPVGQPVLIELVLTNRGSGAADVEHGDPINEDVTVFTFDGDEVWAKRRGIYVGVGGSTRLEPGEQIRLQTLWEQRDLDGFELLPGCYLVRGRIRISDALGGDSRVTDLATEAYELVIQP